MFSLSIHFFQQNAILFEFIIKATKFLRQKHETFISTQSVLIKKFLFSSKLFELVNNKEKIFEFKIDRYLTFQQEML